MPKRKKKCKNRGSGSQQVEILPLTRQDGLLESESGEQKKESTETGADSEERRKRGGDTVSIDPVSTPAEARTFQVGEIDEKLGKKCLINKRADEKINTTDLE